MRLKETDPVQPGDDVQGREMLGCGKYGERLAVDTARILTAPEAACGMTEMAGRQPICTSPRIIAVIAAGEEA